MDLALFENSRVFSADGSIGYEGSVNTFLTRTPLIRFGTLAEAPVVASR